MITKGSYVTIRKVVLDVDERAPHIPEDTKSVPLIMWVKGHLLEDCYLGDTVKVKTITGRIEEGACVEVNPAYMHHFGEFVPEVQKIGQIVKNIMFGDDIHE